MKKIFLIPVILLTVLFVEPGQACSQKETGDFTGGACSVSELMKIEKSKAQNENAMQASKRERDLRPVRQNPQVPKSDDYDKCLFGMCLIKSLLEK